MKVKKLLNSTVLLFAILLYTAAFAQDVTPKVTKVADNLYMVSGLGASGNVSFLVTSEGVLVVDSGVLPAMGKIVMEKIREKTDKPIKYLVFTHFHGDHTYGFSGFPPGITVIGHRNIADNIKKFNARVYKENIEKNFPVRIENMRNKVKELKAKKSPEAAKLEQRLKVELEYMKQYKTIKIKIPDILFDKKKNLKLGGETIELIYPGSTHTSCNCLVYFPRQKSIHVADLLFHELYPYFDLKDGVDTQNWIESLKKVAGMDIEKVIPGHGKLAGKKGILQLAQYLTDLRKAVNAALKKGLTLEEMKKKITFPAYKHFKWEYLRPHNIENVYYELTGKKMEKKRKNG